MSKTIDMAGLRVFLAMPTHRDLHPQTVASIIGTRELMRERGIPLAIEVAYGGSLVSHGRAKMAAMFLEGDCNRLFWVDSDMVWDAKDFLKVAALSVHMPIVAAAYTAKQDPPLFMVRPVLGEVAANEWGCIPMRGLGLGFCCLQREAVETIAAGAPLRTFHQVDHAIPNPFIHDDDGNGSAEGEDMAFLRRAEEAGIPLWVDPTIELGHVGTKVYRARLLDHITRV